jgi:hypothetical protein
MIEGLNRIGVSPTPSPEDRNRSSLRNVVFSTFLEYLTMDKVQEPSNSERNVQWQFERTASLYCYFNETIRENILVFQLYYCYY